MEFADAIVDQILKWDRNFARTPMIAERPRWLRRKEAGESGSKVRAPTPPAPPSGSAAAENFPMPPPGPTGAEQESR
eukprot:9133901-Pyramimonas_sp.AAC.1